MKDQLELNKMLFSAVESCNFEKTEQLLKQGADPIGFIGHSDDTVLGELFFEMGSNENLDAAFPDFLQLFYKYGMNIAGKFPPFDSPECYKSPLWILAFCTDEVGLRVLHTMLEKGLDCDSAEVLLAHVLSDMEMFGDQGIDDEGLQRIVYGLKMVMLVAAYPDVLEKSANIQEWIYLAKNDARRLAYFRNWNEFDYDIDLSTCSGAGGLMDATVIIQNKQTKEVVWKMLI